MVDMSQTADSETLESESESDSDDEDDKSEENMKNKETMEEPRDETQEKATEVPDSEEEQEATSSNDQDKDKEANVNSDKQDDLNEKTQSVSPDLPSYINRNLNQPTGSNNGEDDDDSVGTAAAGNKSARNINQALDGYTASPATSNVVYCKAKIQVPSSEKPTEQLRNTIGMFLTTLLKVDKDFVLYVYKEETTVGHIKLPTQVPEVMSKI